MAGYVRGSQAWYDHSRKRIIEIGKKLQNPDINQETRDKLYDEQIHLALELDKYADDENLVNNPIE